MKKSTGLVSAQSHLLEKLCQSTVVAIRAGARAIGTALASDVFCTTHATPVSRDGCSDEITITTDGSIQGLHSQHFRRVIMLVLTRKRSEMIQIGDNVIIKVIEMTPRWVKIGIEAPDDVRVIRAELFGKPGPQHPLTVFLQQRRAEKQAGAHTEDFPLKTDECLARFDLGPVEIAPHVRHG
jgi:carbon storage regulator